jgi:hypothetical protein
MTIDLEVEQAAVRDRARDLGDVVRSIRVGSHEIRTSWLGQLGHDIVGEPRTHRALDEPRRAA